MLRHCASLAGEVDLSWHSLRSVLLLTCIFACDSQRLVVQIPFEEEHRAAVVAVELRGSVSLYSVDASMRNAQPVLRSIEDWNDEDPIALQVVRYRESLEELRLPGPGSLTSASFGRTLSVQEI